MVLYTSTELITDSEIDLILISTSIIFLLVGFRFLIRPKSSLRMKELFFLSLPSFSTYNLRNVTDYRNEIDNKKDLSEYSRDDIILSHGERKYSNKITKRLYPFVRFTGIILIIVGLILVFIVSEII